MNCDTVSLWCTKTSLLNYELVYVQFLPDLDLLTFFFFATASIIRTSFTLASTIQTIDNSNLFLFKIKKLSTDFWASQVILCTLKNGLVNNKQSLISEFKSENICWHCSWLFLVLFQIDELYMRNIRNDMNSCLLSLITEALVARFLTPERLVVEHTALIAVLHANVGLEVG